MPLVLKSQITVGSVVFDFVHELEFDKSVDTLTNSGFIQIPKNLVYKNGNEVVTDVVSGADPLFKRGDAVEIQLGYEPNLQIYFTGFVDQISPTFPIMFNIDDSMFGLKNTIVDPINLKKTTVSNLLTQILPEDVEFDTVDANLGNFRIKDPTTVVQVLDFIKKRYGLSSYFKPDGILNVGLAFPDPPNLTNPHVFQYGKNIIDDSTLKYKKVEDQLIKIKAVSIFPDNTKVELDVGDPNGELRTLYQYNMSKADLQVYAEEQLNRLKYEGFEGSFETFLEPKVEMGEAVRIIHDLYPEKDGVYLVKSVNTKFGVGLGGKQTIELERKIDD